jgi:hypothetical protein
MVSRLNNRQPSLDLAGVFFQRMSPMSHFQNEHGRTITYKAVQDAMDGKLFTMNLTDQDEIKAIIAAVNQGIDAHLEACSCPDRGDRYDGGTRKAGKLVLCRTLECSVSPESLPVLLRRLFDSDDDAGNRLASDILTVLGFNEYEECVGREAMGLA